jgi:hypothetical protein
MKRTICIFLILMLGGCTLLRNTVGPFEPTFVVASSEYLGSGITFNKVRPESYMKESELFVVASESELALLVAKKLEKGVTKVSYRSDSVLSLQRTFMYLEAIVYLPFTLSMGYTEYTRFGSTVDKVYFAEVKRSTGNDAKLAKEIDDFLSVLILEGKNNSDQLKTIHDRLVRNTKYDISITQLNLQQSAGNASFEAYGVFDNKIAVCSGYSKALMGLAAKRGIPALYIASLSMEHAWNLVFDGTGWVYIDATWDDPIPDVANRTLHTYLLLDSKKFLKDGKHKFDASSDNTLNEKEYLDFAAYVFPNAKK